MSQENVEIVRTAVDALDRGDVEGAFSSAAPDAEFDQTCGGNGQPRYTRDEFQHLTETFISAWESVRWLADEFIDAGEHVVMPFTNRLPGGRKRMPSVTLASNTDADVTLGAQGHRNDRTRCKPARARPRRKRHPGARRRISSR